MCMHSCNAWWGIAREGRAFASKLISHKDRTRLHIRVFQKKTLFLKINWRNLPIISLEVSLKESKRIFDFAKV